MSHYALHCLCFIIFCAQSSQICPMFHKSSSSEITRGSRIKGRHRSLSVPIGSTIAQFLHEPSSSGTITHLKEIADATDSPRAVQITINACRDVGKPLAHALTERNEIETLRWVAHHNPEAINEKNSQGETVLHKVNDEFTAGFLIQLGAQVNAQNNSGDTPLHHAISAGNDKVARTLLQYGADISVKNRHNQTPLCKRVTTLTTAGLLLAHDADVHDADDSGMTLLHSLPFNMADPYALTLGKLLLRLGANLQHTDNQGNSLLHNCMEAAATGNKVPVLLTFMKQGISSSQKNKFGYTPSGWFLCTKERIRHNAVHHEGLNKIIEQNQKDLASVYIEQFEKHPESPRSDIKNSGSSLRSSLHSINFSTHSNDAMLQRIATGNPPTPAEVRKAHLTINEKTLLTILNCPKPASVDTLLWALLDAPQDASFFVRDLIDTLAEKAHITENICHLAVQQRKYRALKYLLDFGYFYRNDENILVDEHSTHGQPLLHAITDPAYAILLAKHNVNLEGKDKHENTALAYHVEQGNEEMVTTLLTLGANVNATNEDTQTPLGYRIGSIATALALLAWNADVNHKDDFGYTPLHSLIHSPLSAHDKVTIARLLLRAKADPLLKDEDGNTLLHTFAEHIEKEGAIELIKLFLPQLSITQKNYDGKTAYELLQEHLTKLPPEVSSRVRPISTLLNPLSQSGSKLKASTCLLLDRQ